MKGSRKQWYIGTPNGVVLCINERQGHQFKGRFYHGYSKEAVKLESIEDMVFSMEQFFNTLNFPYSSTSSRTFGETDDTYQKDQELKKIMTDEELLSRHGDLGSFIIRVQHRQNSSWQGRITWMEEDKTVYFRSMFEMIKLIESALDNAEIQDEEEKEATWESE